MSGGGGGSLTLLWLLLRGGKLRGRDGYLGRGDLGRSNQRYMRFVRRQLLRLALLLGSCARFFLLRLFFLLQTIIQKIFVSFPPIDLPDG